MEDERIVELYWNRDEEAIRCTFEKYGTRLLRLSMGIVGDRETAEECESDTYLEAWNSIPPHEPKTYLFAFLARITRHFSLNACRNRSRLKRSAYLVELSGEMEECIPAPDDVVGRVDGILLGEAVSGWLRTLPETKRWVFMRRYWYLDPVSAIAKSLDCSESRIKTMLCRIRGELKGYLEKEGYRL